MPSRRLLLQSLAAASAAPALTPRAAEAYIPRDDTLSTPSRTRTGRPDDGAPWHLFAPRTAGTPIGLGWVLEDLEPVRRGAAVLVLRGPEGVARVHICRRTGAPRGVAWTHEIDLLLMNGGDGEDPTREGLGRVLRLLAADMRGPTPAGLLTHDERLALYEDDAEVLT